MSVLNINYNNEGWFDRVDRAQHELFHIQQEYECDKKRVIQK